MWRYGYQIDGPYTPVICAPCANLLHHLFWLCY